MVMLNIKFYCIIVDGSVSVELIANNDKFIFGVKPATNATRRWARGPCVRCSINCLSCGFQFRWGHSLIEAEIGNRQPMTRLCRPFCERASKRATVSEKCSLWEQEHNVTRCEIGTNNLTWLGNEMEKEREDSFAGVKEGAPNIVSPSTDQWRYWSPL